MKQSLAILGLLFALSSQAEVRNLQTAEEFNELIDTAEVPVVVMLEAYWCKYCKTLKTTLNQVAPNFSEDEVVIATVDAFVNRSLKKYIKGAYPTTRAFFSGRLLDAHFVGAFRASYVEQFIENQIQYANDQRQQESD